MSNMSYCRFENTLGDLRDCYHALREGERLSLTEFKAAQELFRLCTTFTEEIEFEDIKLETPEEEVES